MNYDSSYVPSFFKYNINIKHSLEDVTMRCNVYLFSWNVTSSRMDGPPSVPAVLIK